MTVAVSTLPTLEDGCLCGEVRYRAAPSHCGTPRSFEFLDSDHIDLSVGSLDDPPALTPPEHFGVEPGLAANRRKS